MEYVRLGTTGTKVSRICLGTMSYGASKWRDWVLDEAPSQPFYRRAVEAGINFFDTADMYSDGVSEEVTGRALKALLPRDQFVLATKVFNPMGPGPNDRGLSRKHIFQAIDASLKRLSTDYVDLYQIHRWDPQTTWCGRGRPGTSALRAWRPGNSPRPSRWPGRTAGRDLSPCRTTTTSSTGRKSAT